MPYEHFDLPIVVRIKLQVKTDHILSLPFSEKFEIPQ
jgi:hypothetical protein